MSVKGGAHPWVGERMRELVAIVVASPGITMKKAAERLGPGKRGDSKPVAHLSHGKRTMRQCNYKTIDRALRYSLIRADFVFPSGQYTVNRAMSRLCPLSMEFPFNAKMRQREFENVSTAVDYDNDCAPD
jgi:hypothetical protein